ncbi:MAG: hypothetical protein P1V81_13260 [Planctomycetota bacterium]|nr:hypothetical protein [Planctomycetota bacterium]
MQQDQAQPTEAPLYEDHLKSVHSQVRDALSGLFEAVAADPSRPQEFSRRFGINTTTAWKLGKIVQEPDPYTLVQHLSGRSGVRIMLRAFEKEGASAASLYRFMAAYEEFEHLVEVHAGDRQTLEKLQGGQGPEALRQQLEQHRKLAFRGNSCSWGVQAAVNFTGTFIAPSEQAGMTDAVYIGGLLGFQRLQPDAAWRVGGRAMTKDDGSPSPVVVEPLDTDFEHAPAVPLIREFSSDPAPPIRRFRTGRFSVFELEEGPVGGSHALDMVTGTAMRPIGPTHSQPQDRFGEHCMPISTPSELYFTDIFVHREMEFARQVRPYLYSRMDQEPYPEHGRERKLLRLAEELVHLGGPSDLVTPEFPRYGELVQWTLDRVGWSAEDFHVYRLRLPYPPIPSLLVLRYELPEADSSSVD